MGKVAAKLWDRRAHPPRTLHHATPAPCATTPVALGEWPRTPPPRFSREERRAQLRPAALLALFSLPRRTEFLWESPTRARCRPLLPVAAARGPLPWTPAPGCQRGPDTAAPSSPAAARAPTRLALGGQRAGTYSASGCSGLGTLSREDGSAPTPK